MLVAIAWLILRAATRTSSSNIEDETYVPSTGGYQMNTVTYVENREYGPTYANRYNGQYAPGYCPPAQPYPPPSGYPPPYIAPQPYYAPPAPEYVQHQADNPDTYVRTTHEEGVERTAHFTQD